MPGKRLTPPQMAQAIAAGETVIVRVPDFDKPTGTPLRGAPRRGGVFREVVSVRKDDIPGVVVGRWRLLFKDSAHPAALITWVDYAYERKAA